MAKELTEKQKRITYGVTKAPLVASRILVKGMDHDFGTPAHSALVINDKTGTFTSANVYGAKGVDQRLGKGYDPEKMTHPLPPEGDGKWKAWSKKGYVEGDLADYPVFEAIKVIKAPTAEASKPKGKEAAATS